MLREMRRSPRLYRWHALTGLAEIVGWDGLDLADQALVQRLIRIRIPHEVAEPFDPDGVWYAIPTHDQAAVLEALDLSDPMPVTMWLGQAAASDGFLLDGKVGYFTPVLDGSTLPFVWSLDLEDTTAALSRRFGTAHGYVNWDDYHGFGFATGWCIAENGTIVRYYIHQDDFHQTAPHSRPSTAISCPTKTLTHRTTPIGATPPTLPHVSRSIRRRSGHTPKSEAPGVGPDRERATRRCHGGRASHLTREQRRGREVSQPTGVINRDMSPCT
ncbi:hypothetical protein ACQP1G_19930 [Nocardia sp. CA-107356]|uniref:hypothetical protein n=1 Tax=Nocardia sp. CA-107356 TaxID=3239972 RepID=UPI003D8C8C85